MTELYSDWFERFRLLFSNAPKDVQKQIKDTDVFVREWINKDSSWYVPSTTEQAKSKFREKLQVFYGFIQMMDSPDDREVILVPDTNSLIAIPDLSRYHEVAGQDKYTAIVVPTVLEELDKLKINQRDRDFRDKVASVVRRIKGLRQQGSLLEGVTVNKTVAVRMVAREPDFNNTLHWLDPSNNDDRIIASTIQIQRAYPSSVVVLVTSDINLQNKAEMASLPFSEPPATD